LHGGDASRLARLLGTTWRMGSGEHTVRIAGKRSPSLSVESGTS
jgi:hypothetical protein